MANIEAAKAISKLIRDLGMPQQYSDMSLDILYLLEDNAPESFAYVVRHRDGRIQGTHLFDPNLTDNMVETFDSLPKVFESDTLECYVFLGGSIIVSGSATEARDWLKAKIEEVRLPNEVAEIMRELTMIRDRLAKIGRTRGTISVDTPPNIFRIMPGKEYGEPPHSWKLESDVNEFNLVSLMFNWVEEMSNDTAE